MIMRRISKKENAAVGVNFLFNTPKTNANP